MTETDAKNLKEGEVLKCKNTYLNCFFKDQTYYIFRIEDCLGDVMFTLQHNGHVVNWHLKIFELLLWFEKL